MTLSIDAMIKDVIRREGGFVDHPADRGGPTKFGITQQTLSGHLGRAATVQEVRELTSEVAARIYRDDYYDGPRIDALPDSLQPFLLDAAINHGPGRAIRFLQQVCVDAGFGPLGVDGICGPKTQAAAVRAERAMGAWLLAALVEERRNFYRLIVRRDPSQQVFLKGWLNRIAEFDTYERLVA